ncbi:MAG: macro domain-containing protein, partial [bacterium]
MPLNIIRNDISKVQADAIVNTANPDVAIGAGVDKTIYDAAGAEQLLAERAKIGPMKPGQAAYTPAFNLDAKYIIHTVGPAWEGGGHGEREAVASCYRESLKIADKLECESVAFPLISTGTYGFPKDEALQIAIKEISSFLFEHDMKVYMVVYDKESFVISGKAFAGVRTYIEERDVRPTTVGSSILRESRIRYNRRPHSALIDRDDVAAGISHWEKYPTAEEEVYEEEPIMAAMPAPEEILEDVDEMASEPAVSYSIPVADIFGDLPSNPDEIIPGESFQDILFRHIDRKGLEDPDVYHGANLDRKLFSKIRTPGYKPSKKTALALAFSLRLNL